MRPLIAVIATAAFAGGAVAAPPAHAPGNGPAPIARQAAPDARQAAPDPRPGPAMPDLSDPRMAQTVARMAGAMTRAMMDMPVGEIEAAAQGRVPTAADHGRRLGDIAPPGIDREVERETAHNGAQMQAMGKAMAVAVPGIIRSLEHAAREAQRAAGTLPDPTYPRR